MPTIPHFPIPRGALVVSCQARPDNPLHGPGHMAAMARAAEQGGARGFRADGAADVAAIRAASRLPIVGIAKRRREGIAVSITPEFTDASDVAAAGADLIGIDATLRPRGDISLEALIEAIRQRLGRPVFADVATREEGLHAASLGVDCVATTLSGYTAETAHRWCRGPDLALVAALVSELSCPVIAEGRFETPEQVREAFALGVHAVVVGTAITNPREITRRFVTRGAAS